MVVVFYLAERLGSDLKNSLEKLIYSTGFSKYLVLSLDPINYNLTPAIPLCQEKEVVAADLSFMQDPPE